MYFLIVFIGFWLGCRGVGWLLGERGDLLQRAAAAIILGSTALTWLLFISAASAGYSVLPLFLITTAALCFCDVVLTVHRKSATLLKDLTTLKKESLIGTIIFAAVLFPLFRSHAFLEINGSLYSGGSSWGDYGLHATQLHQFAYQKIFDLSNPIFASEQTSYPFLVNFLAGQLHRFGASLQLSFILTSFPILLSGLLLLASSVAQVSRSWWAGWLTVFLLLTTGSATGMLTAWQDWHASGMTITQFAHSMPVSYGFAPFHGLFWSNSVSDMFLPQRGFTMGFAVAMLVLWLVIQQNPFQKAEKSGRVLFLSALLIGSLPLLHIHSWAVLTGLLCWFCIWAGVTRQKVVWKLLLALLLVSVTSAPQLWWQLAHTGTETFLQFKWGWYTELDEWLIVFWLRTWGMYAVVLALLPWLARYCPPLKPLKILWLPAVVVFLACNVLTFQPYLYDNTKFLMYVQVFLAAAAAVGVVWIWKKLPVASVLVVLLLSATGVLSVVREYQLSSQIASTEDQKVAAYIREHTPAHEIFLTASSHTHPAMMLAGRKTVVGYHGWLWTHGIEYQEAVDAVRAIYAGSPDAYQLLTDYQIKYVYISPLEREEFTVYEDFFEENFPVLFKNESTTIYQTSENN